MDYSKNHIITAASENYYWNTLMLIYSFERAGEHVNSQLIIFDIGLSNLQRSYFKDLVLIKKHISFRNFEFDQFPEFVKPHYSTYSWKPIIIWNMLQELEGNILWLDSANIILQELNTIWKEIKNNGCYIPYSGSGTLQEWTVKETLNFLHVDINDYNIRNRAGNICGFSAKHTIIKGIVQRWQELALIRECIRPSSATRQNHRDDQSLLTILIHQKKDQLKLTSDEVNISSSHPLPHISVRHKGTYIQWMFPGFFPFVIFKLIRKLDIIINHIK